MSKHNINTQPRISTLFKILCFVGGIALAYYSMIISLKFYASQGQTLEEQDMFFGIGFVFEASKYILFPVALAWLSHFSFKRYLVGVPLFAIASWLVIISFIASMSFMKVSENETAKQALINNPDYQRLTKQINIQVGLIETSERQIKVFEAYNPPWKKNIRIEKGLIKEASAEIKRLNAEREKIKLTTTTSATAVDNVISNTLRMIWIDVTPEQAGIYKGRVFAGLIELLAIVLVSLSGVGLYFDSKPSLVRWWYGKKDSKQAEENQESDTPKNPALPEKTTGQFFPRAGDIGEYKFPTVAVINDQLFQETFRTESEKITGKNSGKNYTDSSGKNQEKLAGKNLETDSFQNTNNNDQNQDVTNLTFLSNPPQKAERITKNLPERIAEKKQRSERKELQTESGKNAGKNQADLAERIAGKIGADFDYQNNDSVKELTKEQKYLLVVELIRSDMIRPNKEAIKRAACCGNPMANEFMKRLLSDRIIKLKKGTSKTYIVK